MSFNADEYYSKLLKTKNSEFWYHEDIDEEGYFYAICAQKGGLRKPVQQLDVIITNHGVTIEYIFGRGGFTRTNITPDSLFGVKKSLTHEELEKVLDIVEKTGYDGKSFSQECLDELYEEWKRLGKP